MTKLPCLSHVKVFVHSCPDACCKCMKQVWTFMSECLLSVHGVSVRHSCPDACCQYTMPGILEHTAMALELKGSCVPHAFLSQESSHAPISEFSHCQCLSHTMMMTFLGVWEISQAGECFHTWLAQSSILACILRLGQTVIQEWPAFWLRTRLEAALT